MTWSLHGPNMVVLINSIMGLKSAHSCDMSCRLSEACHGKFITVAVVEREIAKLCSYGPYMAQL